VTQPDATGEPESGAPAEPAAEAAGQAVEPVEPVAETIDSPAAEPAGEKEPEPIPEAVQAPLIVPCSFEGCDEPGQDTPEGWLCPTHARKKADAKAAKSEKARQ
jgi:hypothetical protein